MKKRIHSFCGILLSVMLCGCGSSMEEQEIMDYNSITFKYAFSDTFEEDEYPELYKNIDDLIHDSNVLMGYVDGGRDETLFKEDTLELENETYYRTEHPKAKNYEEYKTWVRQIYGEDLYNKYIERGFSGFFTLHEGFLYRHMADAPYTSVSRERMSISPKNNGNLEVILGPTDDYYYPIVIIEVEPSDSSPYQWVITEMREYILEETPINE